MTLLKVGLLYRHFSGHTPKKQLSGRITDTQTAILTGASIVKITGGTCTKLLCRFGRSDDQFQGCKYPAILSEGLRKYR